MPKVSEAYLNGVLAGKSSLTSCTKILTPVGWADPHSINPYCPYSQIASYNSWKEGFEEGSGGKPK